MQITLTFNEQLNSSLQIGDTVWYLNTNQAGGYDVAKSSLAKKLGIVEEIINQNQNNKIIISNDFSNQTPDLEMSSDFISTLHESLEAALNVSAESLDVIIESILKPNEFVRNLFDEEEEQ